MTPSALLGPGLALLTALLWGLLPLALKQVLSDMDAWTITFYRFGTAAAALLLWQGWRGALGRFRQLPGAGWLLILASGGFLCINYGAYLLGLDHLDAGTAQVVIQLAPVLLLLGSVWLFREPFSRSQAAGVCLLLIGFALFFNRNLAVLFADLGQYSIGVLIIILAAVTWAAYALLQKRLLRHLGSMNIMLAIYLMGTLLFLPAATPSQIRLLEPGQLLLLMFCCLNTLVAYGAFAESLAHWHASKVSAVLAITPLITLFVMDGLLLLGVQFAGSMQTNTLVYLGAGAVVYGSMLATLGRRALPQLMRTSPQRLPD